MLVVFVAAKRSSLFSRAVDETPKLYNSGTSMIVTDKTTNNNSNGSSLFRESAYHKFLLACL